VDYYLHEISRREQERATQVMVEQTKAMVILTCAITLLTALNVAAVIIVAVG
jgi:CHASE3 domain sensor protein